MSDERVDAVFRALSDPTRRRVLALLADEGAASPTRLAGVLPISRQAVAKHLGVLAEAGLAERERAGREARYRLNGAPLREALAWMAAVGASWDERLDRLTELVED